MSDPVWTPFLTERDKEVMAACGFGGKQGFGKRPAILIVDVSYAFCGDKPEPILESIKRWRNSCGDEAWESMKAIGRLLAVGRDRNLPVIYTTGTRRPDGWDAGSWAWKNSRSREGAPRTPANVDGDAIVAEIAPQPRDIVITKRKPSAFHASPLMEYLMLLGADSLIIAGTTTSGCVRATAVDAFSYNYRVAVVEEGCFDRFQASHAMTLFDLHAKYADVLKLDQITDFIGTLPDDLFKLPQSV